MTWIVVIFFSFNFFVPLLSAPQWSAQVSHETNWLEIYLSFSVPSNRFCVREKFLKIKYSITGNGASDPVLGVSVAQVWCPINRKIKQVLLFKVLSLFTVYQWTSGLCVAASGEYGNCVSDNECFSKRGVMGGPCAEGYGICCVCKHPTQRTAIYSGD